MSKSLKMIIEALLFSSDKPLTIKDIHDCVPDADRSEIKNSLKILQHDYEALERSFQLKEVAGGVQFRSRPEYGSYILRMYQRTPNRLSKAALETLAIIAYKQPVIRNEIERLRGVDVGGIIRTLLEKGLIKIMGRKDLPGRPLIYGTTKRFLEVFDLKDLASLPKLKEIKDFAVDQYEPTTIKREAGDGEEGGDEENNENNDSTETDTATDNEIAREPVNEELKPDEIKENSGEENNMGGEPEKPEALNESSYRDETEA